MGFQYDVFDHVQLAAPRNSEAQARAFYADVLGFEEIDKPPLLKQRGGVWFQSGAVHIHIGIAEPFVPAKKAHPGIRVKNLRALKDFLLKKGQEVTEDDRLPGANRLYVNDPFGNRIEFIEWIM